MAQKKAMTDEELLAQLEGLGAADGISKVPPTSSAKPSVTMPSNLANDDPLAELENLAKAKPPSRPATPRTTVRSTAPSSTTAGPTPASTVASARTSDEVSRGKSAGLPRKSGESNRSFHQGFTPTSSEESVEERERARAAATPAPAAPAASIGGGWWGGLLSTATAAVNQAQAAVKEIQKSEETQRWMDQVRGNVNLDGLNKLRSDIQSRALPTFTNIINTIAPPISQHERLQIHIIHDFINYPSLDPTVHNTFSRVMSQVEGGDLLVIQRGSEATQTRGRASSDAATRSSGWHDGPWWRDTLRKRDMNITTGLPEGTKLCRVNAESYANEFFAARGGMEEATKKATESVSEAAPVRSSDIFLAVQAIGYDTDTSLFQGSAAPKSETTVQDPTTESDAMVVLAVFLHDPVHAIDFSTLSQPFPRKWVEWLDASSEHAAPEGPNTAGQLPAEIVEMIESGGVDPREWASEWIEEILSLSIGVVAQRYVARRMGVGEGGIGKGKGRAADIDAGAGEAARAGMI